MRRRPRATALGEKPAAPAMHEIIAMKLKVDRNKLEESTRLVGTTSWAAIVAGAVVALAIQVLLLLLGLALALSIGDHAVAGGYALWSVLVELFALAIGSALAAHIAHPGRELGGIVTGVLTWATVLVLGGVLGRFALVPATTGTSAWAGFLGALLGLVAAIIGGVVGSTGGRHIHLRRRHNTMPMGTPHTGPM